MHLRKRRAIGLVGITAAVAASLLSAFALGGAQADAASSYSFFTSNPTAAAASHADSQGMEAGMRFRSSVSGYVTGVRFYKGAGNTGTHIGSLWRASGTELGRVTFANETSTGWQRASFATPIPVDPGVTYVVAYYAPKGHYAQTTGYFKNPITAGPLTAPASGNGMFLHGSRPRFPIHSHDADNYWVDVAFEASPAPSTSSSPQSSSSTSSGVATATSGAASSSPSPLATPTSSAATSASATPTPTSPASTTSSSAPAPPPTTSAPVQPTTTSAQSTGSSLWPSQVLDLTNWKLTLPIAAPGSSTAMEIKNLNDYSINPYFVTTADGTGVSFVAPVGGATTSGSGYPRSELREMTSGGAAAASWSTTSGTSTMVVREASTQLPPVKPQVVTAQIHNASDDVIEIVADGTRSYSPGTYSICVRYKGPTQSPCLDTNYVPGTPYEIKLVASGGHIGVYYNGVQRFDFADSESGLYFKAGAYTQSNPTKGDDPSAYGATVVYGLRVTHSP